MRGDYLDGFLRQGAGHRFQQVLQIFWTKWFESQMTASGVPGEADGPRELPPTGNRRRALYGILRMYLHCGSIANMRNELGRQFVGPLTIVQY